MSAWIQLVAWTEERSDRHYKKEPIPTFYFGIDCIRESQKEEGDQEKKEENILMKRANSFISSGPTYSFKSIPFEK